MFSFSSSIWDLGPRMWYIESRYEIWNVLLFLPHWLPLSFLYLLCPRWTVFNLYGFLYATLELFLLNPFSARLENLKIYRNIKIILIKQFLISLQIRQSSSKSAASTICVTAKWGLKKLHIMLPCDPAILPIHMCPRKLKTCPCKMVPDCSWQHYL